MLQAAGKLKGNISAETLAGGRVSKNGKGEVILTTPAGINLNLGKSTVDINTLQKNLESARVHQDKVNDFHGVYNEATDASIAKLQVSDETKEFLKGKDQLLAAAEGDIKSAYDDYKKSFANSPQSYKDYGYTPPMTYDEFYNAVRGEGKNITADLSYYIKNLDKQIASSTDPNQRQALVNKRNSLAKTMDVHKKFVSNADAISDLNAGIDDYLTNNIGKNTVSKTSTTAIYAVGDVAPKVAYKRQELAQKHFEDPENTNNYTFYLPSVSGKTLVATDLLSYCKDLDDSSSFDTPYGVGYKIGSVYGNLAESNWSMPITFYALDENGKMTDKKIKTVTGYNEFDDGYKPAYIREWERDPTHFAEQRLQNQFEAGRERKTYTDIDPLSGATYSYESDAGHDFARNPDKLDPVNSTVGRFKNYPVPKMKGGEWDGYGFAEVERDKNGNIVQSFDYKTGEYDGVTTQRMVTHQKAMKNNAEDFQRLGISQQMIPVAVSLPGGGYQVFYKNRYMTLSRILDATTVLDANTVAQLGKSVNLSDEQIGKLFEIHQKKVSYKMANSIHPDQFGPDTYRVTTGTTRVPYNFTGSME